VRQVADAVDAKVAVVLPDANGTMQSVGAETDGFAPGPHDQAVARWVLDHGEIAGHGTATLPGSEGLYLPLVASHGAIGVLGVLPNEAWREIGPDRLHLLEAFAGLVALAVERVALAGEAARVRVQMETERLRSSLLSAVSHDLRTPLSVITGGASTLLESDHSLDEPVRRELLESILVEADHLNRLVANLLDMTRLEAGALEVRKEWQSVEEIVGAALGRMSRQLKDHPVVTRLEAELPFVPMDDLLVEQVLVNLLENAAKYAPPGSPIELSAKAEDGRLTMEIADRGPGIPPDEINRIFEKFYRASDAARRPGAGLGLAICRGIIELHGGSISAENRAGGGAAFRFWLPLAGTQPVIPVAQASAEA
jgi:two-component system sensor histidine kinase KdpD